MRLLLDTQMLIWLLYWPEILPPGARKIIEDEKNELCFSPASMWEISIKRSQNKPEFQVDARFMYETLLDKGCTEILVSSSHTIAAGGLPLLHKDPFDRLLVAQALDEKLFLLTCDKKIAEYSAPVLYIPR
jgi:PIN domain nuclease of toxin-antitoxin system